MGKIREQIVDLLLKDTSRDDVMLLLADEIDKLKKPSKKDKKEKK